MLVLHDGCMLQRIFDGILKTNKTKFNVKTVWQKHATATLMEPSVLSRETRIYRVGLVFVAQQTVDTPNTSQISVTDSLNHYI